jgi:hypothetical protein
MEAATRERPRMTSIRDSGIAVGYCKSRCCKARMKGDDQKDRTHAAAGAGIMAWASHMGIGTRKNW